MIANKVIKEPAGTMWELEARWAEYRQARRALLRYLGLSVSNRDPLAEYAEHFVAALLDGKLSANRSEPGWDLKTRDGVRVQVKHVANDTQNVWVNEHVVRFPAMCDRYALVIYDGQEISTVLVFEKGNTRGIYHELKKRHSDADTRLNITLCNVRRFELESDLFESLGMQIHPIRQRPRTRF